MNLILVFLRNSLDISGVFVVFLLLWFYDFSYSGGIQALMDGFEGFYSKNLNFSQFLGLRFRLLCPHHQFFHWKAKNRDRSNIIPKFDIPIHPIKHSIAPLHVNQSQKNLFTKHTQKEPHIGHWKLVVSDYIPPYIFFIQNVSLFGYV